MAKKVLVVDDEKPIADILQFNLKKEGYEVYCAYDGDEALKMTEEIKPDLILLDIMLPNRDGMEVCREGSGSACILPEESRADEAIFPAFGTRTASRGPATRTDSTGSTTARCPRAAAGSIELLPAKPRADEALLPAPRTGTGEVKAKG